MGPVARSRSQRTPDQWLRSVIAYLAWRSGDSWLPLSFPDIRNDQERWDYLSAIRLVESIRYTNPAKPTLVPKPTTDRSAVLCNQPRAWLVSELLRADRTLTDSKILSHLPRPKLARMLMERSPAASLCAAMSAGRPRQIQRARIYEGRKAASA